VKDTVSNSSSAPLKRVLSGMRPTGKLHLGNYMGALHNWVRLQHEYECYFFIADWHALTTDYADTSQIRPNTREVILDFLGAGLDPEKCVLFVQSQVKQHAELHLVLSMITPLGWLERVPTYKEQQENLSGKDLSTYGFLGYPLLQSADILLYGGRDTTNGPLPELFVPVGQDQVAHVELTREVARRFNGLRYIQDLNSRPVGEREGAVGDLVPMILPEPQVLLTPSPKLPGTDGRKMSKSYGNTILLTDPEPVLRQKLKPMVTDPARVRRTDPGNPDVCPVGDLHKVFSSQETIAKVYDGCTTASIGCIECKGWVADSVVQVLQPIQERRAGYEQNHRRVDEILEDGKQRAAARAEQTMVEVRSAVGIG
jgi:tryptophanyl-tRNA synthetase